MRTLFGIITLNALYRGSRMDLVIAVNGEDEKDSVYI